MRRQRPSLRLAPRRCQARGIGAWRLVRTPNPSGGRDVVSIMETADISKSDLDLAGGSRPLAVVRAVWKSSLVLVRPLPPRADPKVTVSAGGRTADFTATIVPPGVAVLLPKEATTLRPGCGRRLPNSLCKFLRCKARTSEAQSVVSSRSPGSARRSRCCCQIARTPKARPLGRFPARNHLPAASFTHR